jgi:hypothetical protein
VVESDVLIRAEMLRDCEVSTMMMREEQGASLVPLSVRPAMQKLLKL